MILIAEAYGIKQHIRKFPVICIFDLLRGRKRTADGKAGDIPMHLPQSQGIITDEDRIRAAGMAQISFCRFFTVQPYLCLPGTDIHRDLIPA